MSPKLHGLLELLDYKKEGVTIREGLKKLHHSNCVKQTPIVLDAAARLIPPF